MTPEILNNGSSGPNAAQRSGESGMIMFGDQNSSAEQYQGNSNPNWRLQNNQASLGTD
jgi:hypothetical protein